MLKDITLGQFFPGDSVAHKLDPRTKLILVIVYITALFLAKSFVTYGVMFLVLCASIALSRSASRTNTSISQLVRIHGSG